MARKLPPQFEVEIVDISRLGEGVGKYGNRKVFVFGALPGEKVLVRPLKKSRRGVKAAVIEVLKRSAERREARERHFLSCSPWQIVDEKTQLKWKLKIAKDMFMNEAGKLPTQDPEITASELAWNYRNKMEFSFTEDADGLPVLAFHQRFRYWEYSALEECALAQKKINSLSKKIIKEIRGKKFKSSELKNLLLRYSAKENKCIAVLYVLNRNFTVFDFKDDDAAGWRIIYSDPKSPFIVETEILHKSGREWLQESVHGLDLKFYFDGFFQINVRAFESLLDYVIANTKKGQVLSDLYAGVGTVGFALAPLFEKVNSIEFDGRAVDAAGQNAERNNLSNITFTAGAAEKQNLDYQLQNTDTLLVDPPRSGLHPKVIKKILNICPKNFIYISCNPQTQAQNFRQLKKNYKVLNWRLFDMYPQTPHIESVIIMKKKNFMERIFCK